jgi:hypothetical protein
MIISLQASRRRLTIPLFGVLALSFGVAACNKPKAADGDGGTSGAAPAAGGDSLSLLEGFEGEIDVSAKGNRPDEAAVNVPLLIKTGKIRVDIPEQLAKSGAGPLGANAKGYGVFDSAAKKIYVVLDASKQVLVIDLNKSGEQLKGVTPGSRPEHGGSPSSPPPPPPKVTKTGKYDTVAGYKCENWEIASDHREGMVCVAQEGFSWFQIPMTGIPTEHLWMMELLDGKHFPLRFIGYGPDGAKETTHVEVTKIDKRTLPESEFEVPPSYAVIDFAQMVRGFAAMRGAGMPEMGQPGAGMPGMPMPLHHK